MEKVREALKEKYDAAIDFCDENIDKFNVNVKKKVNDALSGELNEDIEFLQCVFCKRKFKRSCNLTQHLMVKHGIRGVHAYWNLFYYKRKSFKNYCKYCGFELTRSTTTFCNTGECRREFTRERHRKAKEEGNPLSKGIVNYSKSIKGKTYEEIHGIIKGKERRKLTSESHKGFSPSIETREKQSLYMKDKIEKGEWTPNIINSYTHWQYKVNINNQIFKFRSTWEVKVFRQLVDIYPLNEIEYETLRLPYEYNGVRHIYIVDFYIPVVRLAIEVKPTSSLLSEKEQEKIKTCREFCTKNDITFLIIDEHNIGIVKELLDSLKLVNLSRKKIGKWGEKICKLEQAKLLV